MSLRKSLGDLLIMTRAERNGTIVLLFLLLIVICLRFFIPDLFRNDESYLAEIEQKIAQLDSLEKLQNEMEDRQLSENESAISSFDIQNSIEKTIFKGGRDSLVNFDPNKASLSELIHLGFPAKVANTLINYRKKGGFFQQNSDLLKIYGLDSILYQKLKPYVVITKDNRSPAHTERFASIDSSRKKFVKIEINSADSAQWTSLPGIGPVFAKRICSFRSYLGGFVSIEQLREVYHLPPETYEAIKDHLILDSSIVVKINLNFTSINELKQHPYCNFEQAKNIMDYRAKRGSFTSVSQLETDSIVLGEEWNKLKPYLCVN
ncbi:MAG: ComEA family DNA-binding protein [Prolixibacteraceae bacterium]